MADDDPAAADGWLLLVYRVPPEPSRLRSAVWRRLKSLGAIYLQNSAAALPVSVGAERAMRKLRNWYAKVRARDAFGSSGAAPTLAALDACEHALEEYAARVYAEEAEAH